MLPAYQNGALNQDLLIKKKLVQNQKRAYSVVQDFQLIQDTGLASQMNVTIQSNLVVLNALLAESLTYFTSTTLEAGDNEYLVRPQLSQALRQILIVSNTLKNNIKTIQPVINYLSKTDIETLLNLVNDLDDKYTEIFLTANDVEDGLNAADFDNLQNYLSEIEKSIAPVHQALRVFIQQYSPSSVNIPIPSANRQGGYNLREMYGGYFEEPKH
nr:MAG: hypothetical protein [Lake Baikal virophage 14]